MNKGHVLLCALLTVGATASMVHVAAPATARAEEGWRSHRFTNADLYGSYSFMDTGTLQGEPYVEVGALTFDGRGHLSSLIIGYLNGVQISPIPVATLCDYQVTPEGLATATCNDPLASTIAFSIGDHGEELRFIVRSAVPGRRLYQLSGIAKKQ